MHTHIDKIAQNTGWNKDKITAIKNHLFYEEHSFADGTVRRFDSDYWQAEAWRRLENGNFDSIDELLLNHEYYELEFIKKHNCTYEEAHVASNKLYNWDKEVFGDIE